MTDFHPPSEQEDDDLLASLYLDGEATDDQIALIESSPRLLSLVAEFRSIADAVGELPSFSEELQAAQMRSAVDLFMAARLIDGPEVAAPIDETANVRSLADRRANRRTTARLPAWLSAAAATVVLIGGVGFALSQRSSSTSDDTDAAASSMTTARSASATDGSADDGPAENSAEAASESLMADSTVAAEAQGDSAGAESDVAASDMAEAPTTTDDNRVAEQILDVGPLDGRSAIELAELLLADSTHEFRPLEEASCFTSPAAEQLTAEARPGSIRFVPIVWTDGTIAAGPHELVIFEKRDSATSPNSTVDVSAVVLDRTDCMPLLD